MFVLTAEGGRLGYTNPAFGVSLTEEEFREIQRISQLPLDDCAEICFKHSFGELHINQNSLSLKEKISRLRLINMER